MTGWNVRHLRIFFKRRNRKWKCDSKFDLFENVDSLTFFYRLISWIPFIWSFLRPLQVLPKFIMLLSCYLKSSILLLSVEMINYGSAIGWNFSQFFFKIKSPPITLLGIISTFVFSVLNYSETGSNLASELIFQLVQLWSHFSLFYSIFSDNFNK